MPRDIGTMAIGTRAASGAFWMLGSFSAGKAIGMGSNIALARLLFPDDFGVFAIALAVVGVASAFGDPGVGSAVVYEQDADAEHTNSAFWISALAGVLQFAGIVALSQWIGELYGRPLLRDILLAIGVIPFLVAVGDIHQMLLARELKFKSKALLELLPNASSAIISVVAAFLGFGVWSLVIGMISGVALANIVAWCLVPWRPSLHFSWPHARSVIRYSRSLLGMGVLVFLTENVDYLIIGRLLGAGQLGLYSQAFRLASYPETTIVWAVQKVAFPTFSKLRDNRTSLRAGLLKTIHYLSLVSLPSLTLLLVIAPQFIVVVYGPKWADAVVPLQVLCLLGMARSATIVSKEMLMGVGRPDLVFKCNLVMLPGATLGIAVGTNWGIVGVAVAVTSLLSVGSSVQLWLARRQIDLPVGDLLQSLLPGAGSAILLFVGLSLFQKVVVRLWLIDDAWNLLCSILIGAGLYLISLMIFSRRTLSEAFNVCISLRRNYVDSVRPRLVG